MKKIIATLIFAMAATSAARAEGYQVNSLSARQNGMAHTGTAQKLGAESMLFNPAGLAFMNQKVEFTGSFTAIFAHAQATLPDNMTYKTANDPSTPIAAHLGMNVFKNLKAGLSFFTPYGSGINWGENWPGSVLSQKVTLKTFTLQPTLAWRILPNLSVGAGAMVTWGSVNLDKGLVGGQSFSAVTGGLWPAGDTPASINLQGKAAVTVGVNAGVMWDVTSKVTIGASFRSKMNMKVEKGTATVAYANDMAQSILQSRLHILNQANFTASMPCAAVWNLGVSYRPIKNLLLAFDAQLTQWSAYKSLDIEFLSEQLTPYNQHIEKNYRNAMTYKLGAQYSVTRRLDVRAGVMVDTTPVRDDNYNPETPGMTRVLPTVGFSFSPVKFLSIDASLMYVAGMGADNKSVTTTDLLTGQPTTFTANYNLHAWIPAIGISMRM